MSNTNSIIVVGDTHGKYDQYYDIVKNYEYSIQVGDFGFGREWQRLNYSNLDPNKHKICSGNHDDMNSVVQSLFWLGDYGVHTLRDFTFFFIRGGLSIDRVYRIGEWLTNNKNPVYQTYWSNEELAFPDMIEALNLYKEVKPDHVISHVLPISFKDKIVGNNKNPGILQRYGFHLGYEENTAYLLEECFKAHKPKLWVGGHYHKSYSEVIDGCQFHCLNELETLVI